MTGSTDQLERQMVAACIGPSCAHRAPKLLDPMLTYGKHSTSQFLIDNFRAISSLAAPNQPHAKTGPTSNRELPTSRILIDNDMRSREESCASKHSTYKILIDNEFRCVNSALQSFTAHSSLVTRLPRRNGFIAQAGRTSDFEPRRSRILIANEMHSRKQSSHYKQTTYKFLIANEFHFADSAFPAFSLKPRTSSPNRPSPRLEIVVSYRKERLGQFLIVPNSTKKTDLCSFARRFHEVAFAAGNRRCRIPAFSNGEERP